ncbi:hypothetical protein D7X87_01795 [bacterium D16-54]|nr:hypothetical protein D7X87_01795 [bacterium D16-54]RKJ17018.1 hypothetical protein D7X65_01795 [bacterium D16-56]
MFGLEKKEVKAPEKRLADLQRKKDWAGVSRTYYELGVTAMDAGDLYKAQLWLHRADTIYSADDNVYDEVGEKIMDDCSDRIGRLEDEDGLFYNAVPAEIEARAAMLSDPQVRVWGLLSIARLVRLGERLARLPGSEVLGRLDWAVDLMFHSLQTLPSQEAYQRLMDMCDALYELNGKSVYYSGEIEVPDRAPFQLFDLNGLFGVEQELNGYIDSHLRLLAALSQGAEELPEAESGIVGCALLPDYYVRSGADRLEDVPQIKAELQRIWSDYEFVCGRFNWEEVRKRIADYKRLDILV